MKNLALPFATLLLAALKAQGVSASSPNGTMLRVPLYIDGGDYTTLIDISIGTPPQKSTVAFDTTTSEFLMGDKTICWGYPNITCHHKYVPSHSSSYKSVGPHTNISGYPANISTETVDIGTGPLKKQKFALTNYPFSGVIGVGTAKSQSTSPGPIENILDTLNSSKVVGFHLAYTTKGVISGVDELTIGGVDESKFVKPIYYFPPALDSGAWSVLLDTVKVGSTTLHKIQSACVIDTTSYFMIAPPSDAALIHAKIPGSKFVPGKGSGSNSYTVPCDASLIPPISFVFGGQAFVIKPENIINQQGKDHCISNIITFNDTKVWQLGLTFLSNVYTSFEYTTKQVGFATLA